VHNGELVIYILHKILLGGWDRKCGIYERNENCLHSFDEKAWRVVVCWLNSFDPEQGQGMASVVTVKNFWTK